MKSLLFAACIGLGIMAGPASAQNRELQTLAESLASQIKERGLSPVAFTHFSNPEYGDAFSIFIVDRLSVLLTRGAPTFDVVARDRMEEALKEMNLSLASNFDSATFVKLGKQVGAKLLIRGSYTVQAGAATVSLVTQLLDVETGRIVGGELVELPYTGDIKTMLTPRASASPPSPSAASSSTATTPAAFQAQRAEARGIIFELTECAATAQRVRCKFRVTSPETDRSLRLGNSWSPRISSIFDQAGREYEMSEVSLGSSRERGQNAVVLMIVRDVPTAGEISFAVTSDVTTISLLTMWGAEDNDVDKTFSVQFRNVRPAR